MKSLVHRLKFFLKQKDRQKKKYFNRIKIKKTKYNQFCANENNASKSGKEKFLITDNLYYKF